VDYYPTLTGAYPEVSGLFLGSLLKLPLRWSTISVPYLKSFASDRFVIDGFAAETDATLHWIVVDLERAEFDALHTVSPDRIRHLVRSAHQAALDAACTELSYLNALSLECDGAQMPVSSLEADVVAFDRLYQLPAPEQVFRGVDMNNFKVVAAGKQQASAHAYLAVEVAGLKTNSTYAFFAVLHAAREASGQTHQLFSLKNETVQLVVKTLRSLS